MGKSVHPQLQRRIGFWSLTLYGVGVMVGAGVYVLIGEMAGQAGDWTPLAFLLAGAIAAATGASFAELSSRMPEAAGEAAFVYAAFGSRSLSLIVGLAVALLGLVAGAAILKGGVGYLQSFIALPDAALFALLTALIGGLAMLGVAQSLGAVAILTIAEIGGLLAVAGAGLLGEARPDAVATAIYSDSQGFVAGVFLAFFAFLGFEDMVNMAEETRDPQRTMPRAILAAFTITTLIYFLVAVAALRAVDPAALAASERPLALVFERATGGPAPFIAAIAVAAALNGVLVQIVMAARILFGLGRRWRALAIFHETHPRFGTPQKATVAATVVLAIAGWLAPLESLATLAVGALLLVFALMNLALIRLKLRSAAPAGALDLPYWTPWLGLSCSIAMLVAYAWAQTA